MYYCIQKNQWPALHIFAAAAKCRYKATKFALDKIGRTIVQYDLLRKK